MYLELSPDQYRHLTNLISDLDDVINTLRRQLLLERSGLGAFQKRLLPDTPSIIFSQQLIAILQTSEPPEPLTEPYLIPLLEEIRQQIGGREEDSAFLDQILAAPQRVGKWAAPPDAKAEQVSVFLSYARADDEPFAKRLYEDLTTYRFEVWWDRASMPNRGLTFLQEIRGAIDSAARFVLVAGDQAFKSAYVRAEWEYALSQCKPINIALRKSDYKDLPVELSDFDAPDFRDDTNYTARFETLCRQLNDAPTLRGRLRGVPELPARFQPRPANMESLHDLVLGDEQPSTAISAEKRTTTLEGMGGIGKSVLAAAFAYDCAVRRVFPDGIIWLTVGQKPSLRLLYQELGSALGGSLANYPFDERICQKRAQNDLDDKRCLIILDDVWELVVGKAFRDLIAGTSARLLITTRNLQINDLLGAKAHRVGLLDERQAVALLKGWIGRDDPDLAKVAKQLGYLPLALKLAGARMSKDGLSGADYTAKFDRVSRMKTDRKATDRDDNLDVSIALGVQAVFGNDDDEKLLYYTFGIFTEDVAVPQVIVLQLWKYLRPNVETFDLEEILTELVDLALVERHEDKTITLHDLLHSYTREKLGTREIHTHRDLLTSYHVTHWADLAPDEPYLWHWLAHHLIKSGQADCLRALLLDYRFLRAKLGATDAGVLVADCDRLLETGKNETIDLLRSAVMLSKDALMAEPDALGHQLVGRLLGHRQHNAEIRTLSDGIPTLQAGLYPVNFDSPYMTHTQASGPLLRTLSGHTNSVNGALELANGQLLSWSSDNTLRLWGADGQLLSILIGHTDAVTGVQSLSDGRLLSWAGPLTSNGDYILRLWGKDGNLLAVLEGHTYIIYGALELSDGRLLSWSQDESLQLWGNEGQPMCVLTGHTGAVNGALELSDGHLLSWSDDRTLRLWTTDGQPLSTLAGHRHWVSGALQLSVGRLLSWSVDGTLRLWGNDGQLLATLKGHTSNVNGALELSNGRLLSWSYDCTLRLWGNDGQPLTIFEGHGNSVGGVLELSDMRLLSWSVDGTLRLWRTDMQPLSVLRAHTSKMIGTQLLSDGRLLSRGNDGTLRLWGADGQPLFTLQDRGSSGYFAQELSNGRLLSWGHSYLTNNTLRLWESSGEFPILLEGHMGNVNGVLELSNGRLLSWSDDKTLRLWEVDGQPLSTLQGHGNSIYGALELSDGRLLSWSTDGTLRLWGPDGKPLGTLSGYSGEVQGVLELPDGKSLSWDYDSILRLWGPDGKPLPTLDEHGNMVDGALELSDGRRLSWSADGTLRLWADGKSSGTLSGYSRNVHDVLELSDGRLLSWSDDDTLQLWGPDGKPRSSLNEHVNTINGALELSDGRLLSWSDDQTLWLWTTDGQPLSTLVGHSDAVHDALELSDGRLLSWSDGTLRLWTTNGEPIDVLNETAYSGNRETIIRWAQRHSLDPEVILPNDLHMRDGWVQRNGKVLTLYNPHDGKTITRFYGDAVFTCAAVFSNGITVAAGDEVGRVIFLRMVG